MLPTEAMALTLIHGGREYLVRQRGWAIYKRGQFCSH
jgi:hypothetical protein